MKKKTFSKLLCSCIALVAFIIGALSCASAEGTTSGNGDYSNASRDGAQVEVKSAEDITPNVNYKYELN